MASASRCPASTIGHCWALRRWRRGGDTRAASRPSAARGRHCLHRQLAGAAGQRPADWGGPMQEHGCAAPPRAVHATCGMPARPAQHSIAGACLLPSLLQVGPAQPGVCAAPAGLGRGECTQRQRLAVHLPQHGQAAASVRLHHPRRWAQRWAWAREERCLACGCCTPGQADASRRNVMQALTLPVHAVVLRVNPWLCWPMTKRLLPWST